jgi:ParB family transcriptional regulator, chromosome partitioning protein
VVVRQSGLGKGLGALIPIDNVTPGALSGRGSFEPGDGNASSTGQLVDIPIIDIRPNVYQPRSSFDDEGIESLAASIREIGVLQPVLVRQATDGGYELIAGERRWRAAKKAGLTSIPAVVKSADDTSALEQALVENLHRADLNPLEEAAAFQQLIDDFGFTHEQVAERVGKSRASVTNTLRLMQLSPAIQKLVLDAKLSAGHAKALLGTSDKAFQESLARRVVNEELSVRSTEEAVRLRMQPSTGGASSKAQRAPKAERATGLFELEEVLAGVFDTRVSIEMVPNKKGRLSVEFADLNDLERIFRIMTIGTGPQGDE